MISIPKAQRHLVTTLLRLTPAEFVQVEEALSRARPEMYLPVLARMLPGSLTIKADQLDNLLNVLSTLWLVMAEEKLSPRQMTDELLAAVVSDGEMWFQIPSGNSRAELADRVSSLLAHSGVVALTNRAAAAAADHCRTFCTRSRINSDLRPIYFPGDENSPVASLIAHTISLAYHEGGEEREFFVTLTPTHIRTFRDLLDAAIAKEEALVQRGRIAGMRVVGEDNDEPDSSTSPPL